MLTPIIHDSLETCTFLPGWGFDVNVRSGIEIGPQSYALGPNRGSVYSPDRRPQQIRRPGGGTRSVLVADCDNVDRLSGRVTTTEGVHALKRTVGWGALYVIGITSPMV